ncbi:cytochrome c oxidase subunit VB-domain-containing protein [Aspergillus nidulans var. acristatus]
MFFQRTVIALSRRAPARALSVRPFSSSIIRANQNKWQPKQEGKILPFEEIKTEEDLIPPGAKPGTVPTDIEQATGLERLELIGKMQGIDIFDMRPLDASRKGTLDNPIIVNGAGDEQYAGCTGYPADSHHVNWLTVSRERPIERCLECGNVVKLNYIGPEEDPHARELTQNPLWTCTRNANNSHSRPDDHDHGHHHPPYEEPKTFADYVKPEYWYR